MLTRLADWYRIVNPAPPDLAIEQRRAAIEGLLESFPGGEAAAPLVELAILGLGDAPGQAQLSAAHVVTNHSRARHAAFSEDYEQTELDLRVCAGVALGEHLSRAIASGDDGFDAVATAALVLCGGGLRRLPDEHYLRRMLEEISALAREVLAKSGNAVREVSEAAVTDLASAVKAIASLRAQARVDREEINVLWWFFGRHATSVALPLDSLDMGSRALAVGGELANIVITPPPSNAEHLVGAALQDDSRRLYSTRSVSTSWTPALLNLLASASDGVSVLIRSHPRLFPVSWLAMRLVESGGVPGWEQEFEKKTHISVDEEHALLQWTLQIFRERIAQRLVGEVGSQA